VIFDHQRRAIGVEITPNPDFQVVTALSTTPARIVKARKMVIVSCGPLASPLLLERSGIGGSHILNKIGVPVISDLPGVGENLQDHHLLLYPYKTNLGPDETIDGVLSGRVTFMDAIDKKNPMRAWNAGDISSKLRPSPEEVDAIGGEFKQVYDRDFKNRTQRPLVLCAVHNCFFGDHSVVPDGQYMTVATYTAYPYSRGSIHATGKSIDDPPDLDTGFLNRGVDVDALVWAYKKSREIMRRTSYYRGELSVNHPEFVIGSNAALVNWEGSLGGQDTSGVEKIEYSKEDDAVIIRHIRQHVSTTWHSLGTCAMRPREKAGVVDKDLNVYGVSSLKVVGKESYNPAHSRNNANRVL
jgi:choline dehydrogenase-like flavoprotein